MTWTTWTLCFLAIGGAVSVAFLITETSLGRYWRLVRQGFNFPDHYDLYKRIWLANEYFEQLERARYKERRKYYRKERQGIKKNAKIAVDKVIQSGYSI